VGLTTDERVTAIAEFGFTERQARFLEVVMRHAGVCVPRQFAAFASIANGGAKCNLLFDKLVDRGYAVRVDCVHNRARLYHVRYKPLYAAIGEPESRHRRPVPARRAVERLMLLDGVLASPDLRWLTTESEKHQHIAALTAARSDAQRSDTPAPPTLAARTFVSQCPIGVHASGRAELLYLATVPWTDEFRAFVQGHTALLRALPAWTLRIVFPRPLDRMYHAYQQVVHEELETPLHPFTISELTWYFAHRQPAADDGPDALTQRFLTRGAEVYSTPRFTTLYRRWQKHGDTVFEDVASPVLADALANGSGRVECHALPHAYRHLSPLATLVRSTARGVEKGEQGGERIVARPQPHSLTLHPTR
jgi:hypothetical protein